MTPDELIERWRSAGGSERQNSQIFLSELCDMLDVPRPAPAGPGRAGDYVFERPVAHDERGMKTTRFIDLYRRDHFILESKQAAARMREGRDPRQGDLLGETSPDAAPGRGTAAWDALMRRAMAQARSYVADLDADHAPPPFLIVVDVGHVIETYADFSGTGRHYTQFPDRRRFQIDLADLAREEVRTRLRLIWTDPTALDPTAHAAAVTKDVAERLARVAAALERGGHPPGDVAKFLMRCIFTMYAEDVGLLPRDGFTELLTDLEDRPAHLRPALEALWRTMDAGGYDQGLRDTVRRFNGWLFKDATALDLDADALSELRIAASRDWRDVEPAIFGTLIERALDPRERGHLGAHYTPRAYVERLVNAVVMEPLREDWADVESHLDELVTRGALDEAQASVRAFHHHLCTLRVLDPACGSGNFLYVALELLKQLEGEVLERLEGLGGQEGLALVGETVDPSQLLGIEVNPRAAAIAELVVWIGYLRWQIANGGLRGVPDPVLGARGSIECRDAVLAWDGTRPRVDADGAPVTSWDRVTNVISPTTGVPVPDPAARVQAVDYLGARRADWPEAEFVVGNPPFIGGGNLREQLGDGYAEALWAVRREVPAKADFVMQWWDEAALRLTAPGTVLRRFGFITTNSITQTFSRRVVERHLRARQPLSLILAVPDHPWVKGTGRAAVRIAMTVAVAGTRPGDLGRVASQEDLDTDAPLVRLRRTRGTITAKLAVGADVTTAAPLLSNDEISSNGVMLAGEGFRISGAEARGLGFAKSEKVARHIRPYLGGSELVQSRQGRYVIDLFGLTVEAVEQEFPALFGHLHDHVKPIRDQNNRAAFRDRWWVFGEPRRMMRNFLKDETNYIATTETTRHRLFQTLSTEIVPDHMIVAIGLDDPAALALLSSRIHVHWAIEAGGWMGLGNDPRYSKTKTFDPYPFPALLTDPGGPEEAARLDRLRDLGRRLEDLRARILALDAAPVLTTLYNHLERRREAIHGGPALTEAEREAHARLLVPALMALHDDVDRTALAAYGWADLIPALAPEAGGRPGATLPSEHKDDAQEAAEQNLLTRLVALNAERRAEEAAGRVRWLRPDYQAPRLAGRVPDGQGAMIVDAVAVPEAPTPWPAEARAQFRAVVDVLQAADGPLSPAAVARAFPGRATPRRQARVAEVLGILADLGRARATRERAAFTASRR